MRLLQNQTEIRLVPIEGLRGNIYDCNGEALVRNRLSFDIVGNSAGNGRQPSNLAEIKRYFGYGLSPNLRAI